MKIVFFGTSDVGLPIVQALSEHHDIVHIVTTQDKPVGRKQEMQASPIADFAVANNIAVSKPKSVKANPEFWDFLRELEADIFVVVSYGKIMPLELLEIPPLRTVNVHFSLLPKYRGPAPIQFALLNGEKETGTTIFVLDELVDHGPVLAMEKITIAGNDNFTTLAAKLSEISAQLILDVLPKYQSGEITPQEQNHDEATKTGMIDKQDGHVNWQGAAEQTYHKWQAFTPWPGIWTKFEGKIMKILECEIVPPQQADELTNSARAQDIIHCGNGTFLRLNKIQLEGKKPTTVKEFLNGRPDLRDKNFSLMSGLEQ